MSEQDGSGKRIAITATHMGGIKQAPYVIKEIISLMPKIGIDIVIDDDSGQCSYAEKIVNHDLKTISSKQKTIQVKETTDYQYDLTDLDVVINFHLGRKPKYLEICDELSIGIDPLKFEKRHLLNEEEIAELKEKYHLDADRIILGGSLHTGYDIDYFFPAAKKVVEENKKNNLTTQIVVVPRGKNFEPYEEKFKKLNLDYKKSKEDERTDYLLITEFGILDKLYSVCDVAFVGDTFSGSGQNPLEPAFYDKRIVAGPTHRLNKEAYEGLFEAGLLTHVQREDEEEQTIEKLAQELLNEPTPEEMEEKISNARHFIESKQGAAKEYALEIQKYLYNPQLRKKREQVNVQPEPVYEKQNKFKYFIHTTRQIIF